MSANIIFFKSTAYMNYNFGRFNLQFRKGEKFCREKAVEDVDFIWRIN